MKPKSTMKPESTMILVQGATKLAAGLLAVVACLLTGNVAHAHLTYGGRDLGTYSGLTNAVNSITNQTVTGNFGWADAADGILGDTHKGRGFRFRLNNAALINLAVKARPTTNLLVLTPAFSLYSGLAAVAPFSGTQTDSDHDGSLASFAWRTWWVQQNIDTNATTEAPTDGCWDALHDWKIGGDGDPTNNFAQLSSFVYKGSATATVGTTNVAGSFALPAGDYTVMIGGNDIGNKGTDDSGLARGLTVTLTVTPKPTLSIAQKVFVAWPTGTATNWVLQSAASLSCPTWTGVTNTPVIVDGQPGVVLDRSDSQQFFRFEYAP
jgi:hypothetical protein